MSAARSWSGGGAGQSVTQKKQGKARLEIESQEESVKLTNTCI